MNTGIILFRNKANMKRSSSIKMWVRLISTWQSMILIRKRRMISNGSLSLIIWFQHISKTYLPRCTHSWLLKRVVMQVIAICWERLLFQMTQAIILISDWYRNIRNWIIRSEHSKWTSNSLKHLVRVYQIFLESMIKIWNLICCILLYTQMTYQMTC